VQVNKDFDRDPRRFMKCDVVTNALLVLLAMIQVHEKVSALQFSCDSADESICSAHVMQDFFR